MDLMTPEPNQPKPKPGYDVWFGLHHVTLTGFRHPGRRKDCPKCNRAPTQPTATEAPQRLDPPRDATP